MTTLIQQEMSQGRVFAKLSSQVPNFPVPELNLSKETRLLRRLIDKYSFSKSVIAIFNHWIDEILPKQIEARKINIPAPNDGRVLYGDAPILGHIQYGDVQVHFPVLNVKVNGVNLPMTPYKAREQQRTYAGEITATKFFVPYGTNTRIYGREAFKSKDNRGPIGAIPIMLGSNRCYLANLTDDQKIAQGESPNDPLGYFIIKGTEKVITIQEKLRLYLHFTFSDKGKLEGRVTCATPIGTTVVSLAVGKKMQNFKVSVHHLKEGKHYPVYIAYLIMGIPLNIAESFINTNPGQYAGFVASIFHAATETILAFCKNDNEKTRVFFILQTSIAKANDVKGNSMQDLIKYLAKKRQIGGKLDTNQLRLATYALVRKDLLDDLFAHITRNPDTEQNFDTIEPKGQHLGLMISNMAKNLLGLRDLDSRDSWSNKRLETASRSMEQLLNNLWGEAIEPAYATVKAAKPGSADIMDPEKMTVNITRTHVATKAEGAFQTNSWPTKSYIKENITDTLKAETPIAVYSQIGRINTPSGRQGKQMNIRMIQPSQLGYICVSLDSDIILGNGYTSKKIDYFDGKEIVLTSDPGTLKDTPSEITNLFRKMPNQMIKITTISGRSICGDPKHPFLVQRNKMRVWTEMSDLKVGDKMIVKNYQIPLSQVGQSFKIPINAFNGKYQRILADLGYFSEELSHEKLCALARLAGAIWTDGHLSENYGDTHFCVGAEIDADEINKDINFLGFKINEPIKRVNKQTMNNGRIINHHVWTLRQCGAFGKLMEYLGVPTGNKTKTAKIFPQWIINASQSVWREFLSGFQGGDGRRISVGIDNKLSKRTGLYKNTYKMKLGATDQTCLAIHRTSNVQFMNIMSQMYSILGIYTKVVVDDVKDYEDKLAISLTFDESIENICKYSELIGYRYCSEKTNASSLPIEYIRYKQHMVENKGKWLKWIFDLLDQGMTKPYIREKTGVNPSTLNDYVKKGREKTLTSLIIDKKAMGYIEFQKLYTSHYNKVLSPIESIEYVAPKIVSDFTTVSTNHSFYANSFLIHNCLLESPEGSNIGLLKNLSLLSVISMSRPTRDIEYILSQDWIKSIYFKSYNKSHPENIPFMVNGLFRGYVLPGDEKQPLDILGRSKTYLEQFLIQCKRNKHQGYSLPEDSLIHYNRMDNILEYYCDGARPTRPLLIVDDDGQLVIDKLNLWDSDVNVLFQNGAIELIDAREQEFIMLAMFPDDVRNRYNFRKKLEELNPRLDTLQTEITSSLIDQLRPYTEDINRMIHELAGHLTGFYYKRTVQKAKAENKSLEDVLKEDLSSITLNVLKIVTIYVTELTRSHTMSLLGLSEEKIDDIRAEALARTIAMKVAGEIVTDNDEKKPPVKGEKPKVYEYSPQIEELVLRVIQDEKSTLKYNFIESITQNVKDSIRGVNDTLNKMRKEVPYTHSEIDPVTLFGVSGSLEPQPNSGQGPRASYQASMFKQALSYYHYNHYLRFDTSFKVMMNPSRPMFESTVAESAGLNSAPSGTTAICAYLINKDNNEDAIIAKLEFVNNSLNLMLIKYTTHKASKAASNSNYDEKFECPKIRPGEPENRYKHIDAHGLPRIDSYIPPGGCIIGRTRTDAKTQKVTNTSIFAGIGEEGYVDRIMVVTNAKKQIVVKVKIRQIRKHVSGDKIASRYAQKGTISRIIPAKDLPRVIGGINDGLVPDLLINPHNMISRMTIGMLKEMVSSKAALYIGERVDATCFHNFDINYYRHKLQDLGMDKNGEEEMMWPDGTILEDKVFVTPCYYQLLRHHVLDKIQVRSRGLLKALTRQPQSGRSTMGGGGLRVGEMENDANKSHGATGILLERLMYVSDAYKCAFCGKCGNICIANCKDRQIYCKLCGESSKPGISVNPYVLKLIMHMLIGMSIQMNMKFKAAYNTKVPETKHLI